VPPTVDFEGLKITYDPRLLRPRPWTLAQSAWAADLLPDLPDGPVVELCAGAGHIGLRAVWTTDRHLLCVDDDAVALECVRANAEVAGMGHQVEVRQAPVGEALAAEERFALVIADPPWVPHDRLDWFADDPPHAIDGGPDGLDVARACVDVARRHLLPGGVLLLQLGPGQSRQLEPELGDDLTVAEVRDHGAQGEIVLIVPADRKATA
jgi:methylase of polypeptide subunit release factors